MGFPGGLDGKESAFSARDSGDVSSIPGREDPLEEGMATHSSILAWKIPWMEVCDIVQEKGIKTIPKKKKCKKAKWLSEEALQIAVKGREAKSKGEKE